MGTAVKHGPATPPSTAQRLCGRPRGGGYDVGTAVKHGPATPPSTAQRLCG